MSVRAQVLAAAIAVAVGGSVAVAQVRQVQMGTALDANPQVGSYGANKPVPGFVPLNGNEIMSGNVSGLKYFHGNSATISPYSFQGRLGSSALSGFARQSAGNDINPTPLNQSFYLPSATVSTAQGNLYSAPIGSGFDSQLVPRAAISPLASPQEIRSLQPATTDNANKVELNKSTLNTGAEPEAGQPGAVLSSPLFALRIPEKEEVSFGEKKPEIDRGTGTQDEGENGEKGPAKPEGLMGQLNPGRQETRRETVSNRIEARIDARIGGTYMELLDNLRKAETEAAKGENAPQGVAPVKVVVPDYLGDQIDPLTGLPRRLALKDATGRGTATAPAFGGAKRSDVAVSPKRLEDLPQSTLQAGSHVRPLTTFVTKPTVGETITPVDTLMAKAEDSMKHGRYLEAAQSYQSAVTRDPNNPLAVVGRAHAELGAGMYQSAAFDLKFVFTRHPTMVAVHYDMNSFIGETRRDYLLRDLGTLAGNKDTANTANFLLCYVYYQTGKSQELQGQLQKWQEMAEHDTWPSVLSRAWAGDKPARDAAQ